MFFLLLRQFLTMPVLFFGLLIEVPRAYCCCYGMLLLQCLKYQFHLKRCKIETLVYQVFLEVYGHYEFLIPLICINRLNGADLQNKRTN